MFFEKHNHIQVTPNAVATVSPNCSPETLELLRKIALIAEQKINDITEKMKSREILPIEKRLNKIGKYNHSFDNGKQFNELQDLCILYHTALNEAENELFQLGIGSNSDVIFPKSERLPYDNPKNKYIGVSKFFYYEMQQKITKYHKALDKCEYLLIQNGMKK